MKPTGRIDYESVINAASEEVYKNKFAEIRKLFDLMAQEAKPDARDFNVIDTEIVPILIEALPEGINHLEKVLHGVKMQGLRDQIMFAIADFAYAARAAAGYFPPSPIAEQTIKRKRAQREGDRLTKDRANKKAPLHMALRDAIQAVLNERDASIPRRAPGLSKREIGRVRDLTVQKMSDPSSSKELRSDQTIRNHAKQLIAEWTEAQAQVGR